ncbi:MAG: GNAT family N-acetyltransferase [Notoacmeibacter sp.]|nr:GNAT family N-acetyltransferase [Notoacmeibacter sp.]
MRIDVISSRNELNGLRQNWDDLYRADPDAQYFLSWPFISSFFRKFEGEWFVLAARRGSERSPYVALMPLRLGTAMNSKAGYFHNEIHMGGAYVADYNGAVCAPEFAQAAMSAFAKHLRKMHWSKLHLTGLRMSHGRERAFLENLEDRRLTVRKESQVVELDNIDNGRCPSVELPETWDAYLEQKVSSNTRQKLKRLLRKAEESDQFRITLPDSSTVERDIGILLEFWRIKWGPRKGNRVPGILRTNRQVLLNAFADASLFLPVLWHGEKPLGALAIFMDPVKRAYLFYMAGRDEGVDILPPGTVLHAYSIRHAIENGFRTYDFLRGNESYKYSFGATETIIKSRTVRTRSGRNLGDKLDPRSLLTVFRRASRYHKAFNLERAEKIYRQILDTDPAHAPALYGLGQLQADLGDHHAAANTFGMFTRVAPDRAKGWVRLGDALQELGQHMEAVTAYGEAIKLDPQLLAALYGIGMSLLKLGAVSRAVSAFGAILQRSSGDAKDDATRIKAAQLLGKLKERAEPRNPGLQAKKFTAPLLETSSAVADRRHGRAGDRLTTSLARSVATIDKPRLPGVNLPPILGRN